MPLLSDHKKIFLSSLFLLAFFGVSYFFYNLTPLEAKRDISSPSSLQVFTVEKGDGFREIADRLETQGLIRSARTFKILAILKGKATQLKPGRYELSSALSTSRILALLTEGSRREIEVRILEGYSLYEIDETLYTHGIIPREALIRFPTIVSLEGKLFPDTYKFFTDSRVEEVLDKFLKNFDAKASFLLKGDPQNERVNLTLASLVEREVPDFEERKVVAGILKKRIAAGVPLQVDATICYIKEQKARGDGGGCEPLVLLDFKIESPYNTYLYAGWPPGPIGNPGVLALKAALSPRSSPYWYYLSDPVTKKTVFSRTLEEHNANKAKYLKNRKP